MISVLEALKIVEENIQSFKTECVDLYDAFGRVLQEEIRADRDFPSFDKSLMDGIAICFSAWNKGVRHFKIIGTQPAGVEAIDLESESDCVEIMTGAVVSQKADCVIPVEAIKVLEGYAVVEDDCDPRQFQYISQQGSHQREGDLLLKKGTSMLAPQISIAASVGRSKLMVSIKPKVAVISTGDEIVDIDKPLKSFETRKSNSYFLKSAFDGTGLLQSSMFHLKDDREEMLNKLSTILKEFDLIVLSGGVSMGKFDYVPEVLSKLGVEVLFHKVAQRPGKPFWFGISKEKKAVFALPGNPLSTQIGAYRYILHNVRKALGINNLKKQFTSLKENVTFKSKLTYFAPVKIEYSLDACLLAHVLPTGGSGDIAAVAESDGFIELPAHLNHFESGFKAEFFPW